MSGVELVGGDQSGADLSGADVSGADLGGADLRDADLSGANLGGADLRDADLRDADLSGADIDFATWPMWCGGLRVKIDKRIAAQLAYHFCSAICDDDEFAIAREALMFLANQMHRTDVPRLKSNSALSKTEE